MCFLRILRSSALALVLALFILVRSSKAAIGTAKVVSVDAADPKNPKVIIKPVKRLKHERHLEAIRASDVFKDSIMFRQFRLSVVPITDAQYDFLTL